MKNFVNICGNLTRDPETVDTQTDTVIVKLGVAVNDGWGDKKRTSFFDVTAFNKTGEAILKHFAKGDKIEIAGRLQQETWESEGQKRSKIGIIAEKWEFAGGPRADVPSAEGGEDSSPSPKKEASPPKKVVAAKKGGAGFKTEDDDDEISF